MTDSRLFIQIVNSARLSNDESYQGPWEWNENQQFDFFSFITTSSIWWW